MSKGNAWEKRFKNGAPRFVFILVAIVEIVIGGMFLFIESDTLIEMKPSVLALVGLGLVFLGPLLPWALYHFRKNVVIVCGPDGFRVSTETRHGTTEKQFAWSDVTATDYDETVFRDSDNKSKTTREFMVNVGPEQVFRVTDAMSRFRDLIETFNQMTVQVPYTWERQTGFNVQLLGVDAHRRMYAKTPRG
jgi:hypothetical protein